MRKAAAAVLVSLLAGLMVIVPARPAQAAENCENVALLGLVCLEVVDGQAVVTGPGISLSAPVPVQEVPIYVNVPGPTVTVPGATVTVPGATVTAPGAPTTVTAPGSTVTETETQTAPGSTETQTETFTAPQLTTPPGQETDSSATIAEEPKPGESHTTRFIQVTVPQLISFSLLALALGAFVVLLVMYIMYRVGKDEGEHSLDGFLQELRDLTLVRKR